MSKPSSSTPLNQAEFSSDWSQHPAVEWLFANKQAILWTFVALLALLVVAYRFAASQNSNAERDYYQAQNDFVEFQQTAINSPDQALADFEQLQAILQRRPELKAKYQGPLAQTLLLIGHTEQASSLAKEIFKRTGPDQLELYQLYAQTSLLIGEGQYAQALQNAEQLKQKLATLDRQESYAALYVFNQLRLAMLYQELNQTDRERQLWEELQNQPLYQEAFVAVSRALKTGQASLDQYIEERKAQLAP